LGLNGGMDLAQSFTFVTETSVGIQIGL